MFEFGAIFCYKTFKNFRGINALNLNGYMTYGVKNKATIYIFLLIFKNNRPNLKHFG